MRTKHRLKRGWSLEHQLVSSRMLQMAEIITICGFATFRKFEDFNLTFQGFDIHTPTFTVMSWSRISRPIGSLVEGIQNWSHLYWDRLRLKDLAEALEVKDFWIDQLTVLWRGFQRLRLKLRGHHRWLRFQPSLLLRYVLPKFRRLQPHWRLSSRDLLSVWSEPKCNRLCWTFRPKLRSFRQLLENELWLM